MSPDDLLRSGFSKELVVLIISALPVLELRGAIPWAIVKFHFPWYYAFLLAIIGNILPVPFILLFLDTVSRLLSKIALFERLIDWYFENTRRRGKMVERHQRIGLILLVAIPLPLTGAWTGSLIAVIFGLKFKHAFFSIIAGILIAGTIVTFGTLLGWGIFSIWKT